jgi:hypothetical protein
MPSISSAQAEQIPDMRIAVRSPKYHIISTLVRLLLLSFPTSFGILLWALVRYGQNGNTNIPDCISREVSDGFTRNSDFYGFGIRLGLYFQWSATLIANVLLPNDWYAMFGAYLVFSLALIIAVLVLTFQHTCTFTAEIIVIIFMYWAGYTALTYSTKPTFRLMSDSAPMVFGPGLSLALIAPTLLATAFSTWAGYLSLARALRSLLETFSA